MDAAIEAHANNKVIHITNEEREKWNSGAAAAETIQTKVTEVLTFHNTDTTAHQDIRNDLKLKADLEDGKILDTQLPDMDYVPTSRMINGVALTKDITLTAANVNAAALNLSNVKNDDFYKKAKEAGMGQTYFFLHITFSSYFAGQAYTVTGGSFSYSGTVPTSLEEIIVLSEPNVSYTVSCGTTNITVKPTYFGIYDVAIVPELANASRADIARATATNAVPSNWAIGDTKDITLTTKETITLQIYDFNHDDLADGSGRAQISFGMKNLMKDVRQMNNIGRNKGSFVGSEMYAWLTGDLWRSLPDDLKLGIKPVTKDTTIGGSFAGIKAETMSIFLFSKNEITGSAGITAEGKQYPIFTDQKSRIKYLRTGPVQNAQGWWMRSPYYETSSQFSCITSDGLISYSNASSLYGVCFGFCV